MKQRDYHRSVTTPVRAKEAYDAVARVSDWWTNTFKGSATKAGDEFSVTFGETMVKFKVLEAIPNKKAVWLVTDCNLHWIKDKKEWKDTKIVWDFSEGTKGTKIEMTHVGLVPEMECYENCEPGWNQYVGESLPKLIETGKGIIFEGSRG